MTGLREWLKGRLSRRLPQPPVIESSRPEAERAKMRAQRELAQAKAEGSRIDWLAARVKEEKDANHFGQRLERSFQLRGHA